MGLMLWSKLLSCSLWKLVMQWVWCCVHHTNSSKMKYATDQKWMLLTLLLEGDARKGYAFGLTSNRCISNITNRNLRCMMKLNGRIDLWWKKYFNDPSLWHGNHSPKVRRRTTAQVTLQGLKENCDDDISNGNHNNHCTILRRRAIAESLHKEVKESSVYEIRNRNHMEDSTFFVALLKACAKKKDLYEGIRLHASIVKNGLLETSSYLASSLINMYAKCGMLIEARKVLEELAVLACWYHIRPVGIIHFSSRIIIR